MHIRLMVSLLVVAFAASAFAQLPVGDFPVAGEWLGLAPGNRSGVRVATSRDQFFAAWSDERLSTPRAWGARVSIRGEVLDSTGLMLGGTGHVIAVESDGRDFLVAFEDGSNKTGFTRVTAEGGLVALARPALDTVDVVWTGDAYAIFHRTDARRKVSVLMLDAGGTPLGDSRVVIEANAEIESFAAARGGDRVLMAWSEGTDQELRQRTIAASDLRGGTVAPLAPATVRPGPAFATPGSIVVVSDGRGFLAMWYGSGLRARLIDAGGATVRDLAVPSLSWDTLAWDGTHYAALSGREIVRFTRDGAAAPSLTLSSDPNFVPFNLAAIDGRRMIVWRSVDDTPVVLHSEIDGVRMPLSRGFARRVDVTGAWRGDHYLAVWRELSDRQRIVASRFTSGGALLDGTGIVLGAHDQVTAPSLAGNSRGSVVGWRDLDGVHVTALGLDGRIALQQVIAAGISAPVVHWNGVQYLVAFTASIAGRSGVHAIRLRSDGSPIDAAPVFLTETHGTVAAVGWTGQQYVVAFRERTSTGFGFTGERLWSINATPSLVTAGARIGIGPITQYDSVRAGESPRGLILVWADFRYELEAVRFAPDGTLLDPVPGFFVEYGTGSVSSVLPDGDGWLVTAGPDTFAVVDPTRRVRKTTAFPFLPSGATITVVHGGPAPLVLYTRPSEPIRARFVITRRRAGR
jgi:hypothetical protein